MKHVVALFDKYEDAERAVLELTEQGYDREQMSVIARREDVHESLTTLTQSPVTVDATAGATMGAALGGLAGMLIGAGMLTVPGLGAIVAIGTLTATLGGLGVGAGAGAVAGGVLGALTGAGLSDAEASAYAEGIKRGGILVIVNAPEEREAEVWSILRDCGAVNIAERQEEWRRGGWTRFDETATP
ncbi:MAG: general stress protein [Armatimonadota bacterium]|nr:general stress protein [Armatimonadota bacterium]